MQNLEVPKKLIFNKYKIKSLIQASGFGLVFQGINVKENIPVAIKLEKKKSAFNILESEAYLLMNLKGYGIPKIITYGYHGLYNVLIEELLGLSIGDIFDSKRKTFNLKDICMIALQCIDRLEYIHSKFVIHRDIKPHNLVIGRSDPQVIYLIDFGLSRKYRSSRTGKHIQYKNIKLCYGSLLYLSINGNGGYEQSRRDDLESLGYMLIFLSTGYVPWLHLHNRKYIEVKKYMLAYKIKKKITTETLCKGLPEEMIKYINYCKGLHFEQDPDYNYLRSLFKFILLKINQKNDLNFCWISNKLSKKHKRKNISENKISKKSVSPHIRLLNKIKNSLEKNNKNSLLNIRNKQNRDSYSKTDDSPLNIIYQISQDNYYDKDNIIEEFENKPRKKYKKNFESESTKEKELKKMNAEKSISISYDQKMEKIFLYNSNKSFNNFFVSKSPRNQINNNFDNKENKIVFNNQKKDYDKANIINLDNDNDLNNPNNQTINLKSKKEDEIDINKEIEKYIKEVNLVDKSYDNNINKNKFISNNNFWDYDTGDLIEDNTYYTYYNVRLNTFNKDLNKSELNQKKDNTNNYISNIKNKEININYNVNKDIKEKNKTFFENKILYNRNQRILNNNSVYNSKEKLKNYNKELVIVKKPNYKYESSTFIKNKKFNINKNNNDLNIPFNNYNRNNQNIRKNKFNINEMDSKNKNYSPININSFNITISPINKNTILNNSKSYLEIFEKQKNNINKIKPNESFINYTKQNTLKNINLNLKNHYLFRQSNEFDEDINFVNTNKFE